MRHLDIDSLAVLIEVSRRQSFSAAAREIGRSQAAVSFTVARLEDLVKVRLFERTSKGVLTTPAGVTLVTYAQRIIALEMDALKSLQVDVDQARVRLGLPDDYIDGLGALALSHFATAWPRVQVEITCDFSRRLETLVAAGDLDLALITRDRHSPAGEKLRDELQVWCAARDRQPECEAVLPVALFSDQCRARPLIVDALEAHGRPWRLAFSCSHLHGIYAAVERGALAVLPASCVPTNVRVLGRVDELPDLPSLELALLLGEGVGVMARRLARNLQECFAPDQVTKETVATAA